METGKIKTYLKLKLESPFAIFLLKSMFVYYRTNVLSKILHMKDETNEIDEHTLKSSQTMKGKINIVNMHNNDISCKKA